jgi:hypothetical protein
MYRRRGRRFRPEAGGCYEMERSIWDDLLNQNYERLLDTLDDEQKVKARVMLLAFFIRF